eukprot:scaffold2214_cov128-Isochrysis_galbana.AAC.4
MGGAARHGHGAIRCRSGAAQPSAIAGHTWWQSPGQHACTHGDRSTLCHSAAHSAVAQRAIGQSSARSTDCGIA